ncbi:bactofilin family protein [Azospirillum doebereinerae]|uniref:Polymer-forming cytoskeletal protein n=1 Tax=Azospirillum doebereinerae TaxID=92933 RepID=A0A433JBD9_9PROT|nr:polymer-forming cytoskeletal protein [Azospirillum doebereinerae]RUQ73724.1 polymer-forming cytoskeletal protein [Azospirillum doebereinerae]
MLFGRKTPPAAPSNAPKTDSAAATPASAPGAGTGGTAIHASPLASLTTPAPIPATAPAQPASSLPASSLPSMAGPGARSPFPDPTSSPKGSEMNSSSPKPPTAPSIPGAGFKTDVPRRVVDTPGLTPRQPGGLAPPSSPLGATAPAAPVAPAMPTLPEQRRLTVGRDISLSGEIGSCDVLVVEGTVEAKLRNGRSIEIADGGLFKGSVEIEEADIGGRFEGDIAVRGRLTVRSTGKITGSIKYGELAVEAGGQLSGDIQLYVAAPKAAAPVAAPVVPELASADVV